ncbi:hypothetical protein CsSME_00036568 [Camellia sinensis var. sinensis]
MPSICLFQSLMLHVSSVGWQSEYPKYTPLLAKILEGLLSQNNVEDKIPYLEEVISNANTVSYVIIFHVLTSTKEGFELIVFSSIFICWELEPCDPVVFNLLLS